MRIHAHNQNGPVIRTGGGRNLTINTSEPKPKPQYGLYHLGGRGQKIYLTPEQVIRYTTGDKKYLAQLRKLHTEILDDTPGTSSDQCGKV